MIFSNIHKSSIVRFLILVTVCLFSFCISACSESDDSRLPLKSDDSGLALISCITCNGKISKDAFVCPHCGDPRLRTTPVSMQPLAKSKAASIAHTVNMYNLDMGYSNTEDGFTLEILLLSAEEGGGPYGPYLEQTDDIIDPWGNPFEVLSPGRINASFDIVSWGEDGEPGGDGENEDVTQ